MTPRLLPHAWLLPLAGVALVLPLAPLRGDEPAAAPGNAAWEKIDPLPKRFPRWTDAQGCRWGLWADGALGLGGGPDQQALGLLEYAARLAVNGQPFAPASAETTASGGRVRLTGLAGGTPVTRDIWLDRDRGALRYCDTFANAGDQSATLSLSYSSQFLNEGSYTLHQGDGAPISGGAQPKAAVAFLHTQPEGMSSALFLFARPGDKNAPLLAAQNNGQFSHTFSPTLPAGGQASLIFWIVQRPTLTAEEIDPLTKQFFRGGRLVRANISPEAAPGLANFPAAGLREGADAVESATVEEMLAPLLAYAKRLGIDRGEADVYWMGPNSLLEGETQGGPLELRSRFGEVRVPLEEIAAVQGAGGRGRRSKVYLRDGHVLAGDIALPEWKISGARGWTINLNAETLEALILRESAADGVLSPPPAVFAQLATGDVLPLQLQAGEKLGFATPWGAIEVAAEQIDSLVRQRQPAPGSRLILKDGTRLSVFPTPRGLTAQSPRLGAQTLPINEVAALWHPSAPPPDAEAEPEEITDLSGYDGSAVLLRGSNVVRATLSGTALRLLSGATETALHPEEISSLKRAEGSSDLHPVWRVTLASGAEFEGILPDSSLTLRTSVGEWTVPLGQVLELQHDTKK